VLNIEYGVFREGTYFGFDVEALDAILGRSDWDKEILVVNGRQVVVWRNGHGRYEPRVAAKKGDWSAGDTIEFSNAYCPQSDEEEDDCSIDVLSVDHKFGPSVVGKYFNFDKDALDTILGRSDWSNERLGTDKGTVVVWRNPNGGSVGDAHGRFDKLAKKGDWSVGDEITFLDCSTNEIEPEPESKAKQGEICKDGGIVNGETFSFERECEEGLVCTPKTDFIEIVGAVPHTCELPIKPCLGCFTDYDDLDSVQETVDGISDKIFALFKARSKIPVENGARLTVVSAQSQVVAGTNFRVTLNVGSQENVIIQYFVALPYANPDQVPSNIQLIDEGHQYEAKAGELCRDGGVEKGYLFERNCEKGLVCLPKKGVVAIGGEVPYTCQFLDLFYD